MHHAAHHAGLGGGIKVGPWDTLESQQLLTTLRLSRWDLNHLDNSWGCGDFGLYFIPGLGQHCEFCLDGILWHIAASSELLAYVFFVSRWSPLTLGWEPGWQGKTTSVTSHGTMGPLRWSMTIYPARSLVGWISLFLCCWCLPWVLPPMPRCMHCYLASMIIQFLYRMQVHFTFIWPAGRPKPSSFRSWQAYFSMCDWLPLGGGWCLKWSCLGSWDHLRAVRHPWSELHIWLITVQQGAISMGLAKMWGNQKAALYAEGLRGVKAMQRMKLLHIHMPAPLVSRIPNNYLRTPSKIRNKYRYRTLSD